MDEEFLRYYDQSLWQTFEKQRGVCALTSVPISFKDKTAALEQVSSEDGEVQWIHSTVASMKKNLTNEEFLYWCRLCVDKNYKDMIFIEKERHKLDNLMRHIDRVQDDCRLIAEKLLDRGESEASRDLIINSMHHDKSKMNGFEWEHIHDPQDPLFVDAVLQHVKNNDHHPEFWGSIHDMPRDRIAEMTCDWHARSAEFGTDLNQWITERASVRFNFCPADHVHDQIQEFISLLLEKPFK